MQLNQKISNIHNLIFNRAETRKLEKNNHIFVNTILVSIWDKEGKHDIKKPELAVPYAKSILRNQKLLCYIL